MCDKAFETQSRGLMEQANVPVDVRVITAGKFRRYAHLSKMRQLFMPRIVFANIGDLFKVAAGFFQSLGIIQKTKPDVVFAKGGFVCLPLGMAARIMRVPIVIHDSDVRPGLTNRILSRWATAIATGSPKENYSYKDEITEYTGVPIAGEFTPFSAKQQRLAKQKLGFSPDQPLVVATGGGLGAASINQAVAKAAPALLERGVSIYHVTGKAHYDAVQAEAVRDERYKLTPFVYADMAQVLGAADVVISRASATFLQELAGLGKATIAVPARHLGDQLKNASAFERTGAILALHDKAILESDALEQAVLKLVDNEALRVELGKKLHEFARPDAATRVARMVIHTAEGRGA